MQEQVKIVYNDSIVRKFVLASVVFAIVGMLVGVIAALQLAFWQLNIPPFLQFGRLRPLHTNAAIFAFVGNMIFAGVYYSTQRLCKARMGSDILSSIHFWGWQLIIVAAAITLPLGITSSKEYAELEWPIDLAVTVIWVVFAINFFWTLAKRNEKHLYVALWFYISTIVTIAMLYIFNNLELPVSLTKSYSIWAGAQDALTQWWYGHNAVAFFLTTPILGIMYYFMPKAAERPVYSYRLSIVHFWALIFVYIWAGPHHLLNTALPEWAQSLGMIFSVILWAPSWGGMINGLLTLRGAWDKLRTDPIIKFFVAGVTFYGMSTFEGPLLSIKTVNGLAHYTDWIIGHVHAGALGWNGFMAAGMFYWMVPRLFGTQLYSKKAAEAHFYVGTLGILLYVVSMWVSGVTQGMMWRAISPQGGLMYPAFLETLIAIRPMYVVRAFGGTLFLAGMVLMAWNLLKTALSGKAVDGEAMVIPLVSDTKKISWASLLFGKPMVVSSLVTIICIALGFVSTAGALGLLFIAFAIGIGGGLWIHLTKTGGDQPTWHHLLEGRPLMFSIIATVAVAVGGIAELVPSLLLNVADQSTAATGTTRPYHPLELEGRDIYIREGCYTCHSQMIRTMNFESMRYGDRSAIADSIWDHPFQWGSKRTGPDLARIGGKYPNLWHFEHMRDPRSTSNGSNMPPYAFLETNTVNFDGTQAKLEAMQALGVPYTDQEVTNAVADAKAQAATVVADLKSAGVTIEPDRELVALIAYLQCLGKLAAPPNDVIDLNASKVSQVEAPK